MKPYGTDRKDRLLRRLLTSVLLLCLLAAGAGGETPLREDPEMILAQAAASRLGLQTPDGDPLTVWSDPSVPGRGEADPEGKEPEYTGMVGFAAMPKDPDISFFSIFDKAYWTLPLYRKTEEGYRKEGTIPHKTRILVISQDLQADGNGNYRGYVEAVRLDTGELCALDVSCFETLPYWTLPIQEIPSYGYCIAVYRETPGEGPRYEDGHGCMLRDGTRVLIPYEGAVENRNPAPERLQVPGIIFREEAKGTIVQKNVYFRQNDLVPSY